MIFEWTRSIRGKVILVVLATTFVAFIVALGQTTVANVLIVMAIGPFFTALLARVLLGEPLHPVTLAAAAVAAGGIGLTVIDSMRLGEPLGLLLAALVPLAFAANTVLMRHRRSLPTLPGLAVAALLSALLTLPFVRLQGLSPAHIGWLIWIWIAMLGATAVQRTYLAARTLR